VAAPIEWNDSFVQGDDADVSWIMYSVTPEGIMVPIDLTGTTGAGEMRTGKADTAPLVATFTLDSTDFASGLVAFRLTDTDTASIVPGKYYYDLQLIINSKKRTWVSGTLTVIPRVTDG
jgi:hypothetical protein